MDISKIQNEVKDDLIKWRRDLHQIPELGNDLPKTTAYVKSVLDSLGVEYKANVGLESAIVATITGTGEGNGKVIALRGDMDALPVVEETGLDFASTNGCMHACGHDGHTSVLLATVKALNSIKDQFGGTVKFLFQPGEEISAGAEPMVKAGALKNPDVDYILGIHIGKLSDDVKSGTFSFREGPMMACLDRFTLKVKGKGAHGAYPHQSKDSVVMASYIVTALQEIISREIEPAVPGVITIGQFHAGSTYNVIPEEVFIEGTARAVDLENREMLAQRIGEVAENVAKAFRGSVEYEYFRGAPPLINDPELTARVFESAKEQFGADRVSWLKKPVMGGEDFAVYLQEVPGVFIFFQNPLEIEGTAYPHHNPKFGIDEDYLDSAVGMFVKATLDLLKK